MSAKLNKRPFRVVPIDDEPENNIVAQYVGLDGLRREDKREFIRTPGKVFGFWDDSDVVILDLNNPKVAFDDEVSDFQDRLPPKGTIFKVSYGGKQYILDFGASSAKDRRMPLVNVEKRIAARFMETAEQSVYGQRLFLTSARRAVRGSFLVGVRDQGYRLENSDVIEDGMGTISHSFFKKLCGNVPVRMTKLHRQPLDSFQLYRMSWASIKEEASAKMQASMDLLLERTSDFFRSVLAGEEDRWRLLTMEEEMQYHPYCVNAFTRESRRAIAARAYSVPFHESHYKIAMPISEEHGSKIAFKKGMWVIGRYPFSSNAALRAATLTKEDEAVYKKRVARRMGIQYTILAPTDADSINIGAKGMLLVVPDRYMEGCDVILCRKDIKVAAKDGKPDTRLVKSLTELALNDGYLGAIQIYGPGAFFGITASEWEGYPGDFDGDGAVLYECSDFKSFYRAVEALPRKPNYKLGKSKTPYSDRAVSVKGWQMAHSYIGRLSNIMSSTFAVEDRDRLARDMGFESAEALDDHLTYLMQVEVDRFKRDTAAALRSQMKRFKMIDPDRTMARVVELLERNLVGVIGKIAPWTKWRRREDVFRFFVPPMYRKRLEPTIEKMAIPDWWDGPVAELLKISLPQMEEKLQLAATIRPLGYYYNWAPEVSPELEAVAKKIVRRFASELIQVNTKSEQSIDHFKDRWQENMAVWMMKTGLSARVLAAALWRAAHSVDSQYSSAVAPFWCFPHEAERIVLEKPGHKDVKKAKVIGLARRMPENGGPDILDNVEVMIKDIQITEWLGDKGKERRIRLARIIHAAPSDKIPVNPQGIGARYPQTYLAEVPHDAVTYPPQGTFIASFRRVSRGAWVMELKQRLD